MEGLRVQVLAGQFKLTAIRTLKDRPLISIYKVLECLLHTRFCPKHYHVFPRLILTLLTLMRWVLLASLFYR